MYRLPASTSSREHQLNVHRPTCAFAFVLTLSDRRWTSSCPRKWSSWDRRLTHFSLSLRAWIKSHTGSVSPQVCHPKYSDKPGARSRGPGLGPGAPGPRPARARGPDPGPGRGAGPGARARGPGPQDSGRALRECARPPPKARRLAPPTKAPPSDF